MKKFFYCLPRILGILAILFISLFALDAFEHGETIGQQLLAFLIHLIPSFVLLAFLLIAWRWELIGGIIFMLIGVGFTPLVYTHNYNMNHSVGLGLVIIACITFPFFVVGILFLISSKLRKK